VFFQSPQITADEKAIKEVHNKKRPEIIEKETFPKVGSPDKIVSHCNQQQEVKGNDPIDLLFDKPPPK
jgi:hypothetical protein